MDFLKRILSKLGKSGLGEKVGNAGRKALDQGKALEPHVTRIGSQAGSKAKEFMKKHGRDLGNASGGAALGAQGTYLAMGGHKDDEEDEGSEMEEMFKKAKKKSRDWME
jgi:hypothetical protein